jgi:hypothetical protein
LGPFNIDKNVKKGNVTSIWPKGTFITNGFPQPPNVKETKKYTEK